MARGGVMDRSGWGTWSSSGSNAAGSAAHHPTRNQGPLTKSRTRMGRRSADPGRARRALATSSPPTPTRRASEHQRAFADHEAEPGAESPVRVGQADQATTRLLRSLATVQAAGGPAQMAVGA